MQRVHAKLIPILVRPIVQSWSSRRTLHGSHQTNRPPAETRPLPRLTRYRNRRLGSPIELRLRTPTCHEIGSSRKKGNGGDVAVYLPSPASGITRDAR